jgi:hypothetical protein
MVWSTAAALLLSCLGSAALLEPSSPAHVRALGFVEPLLAWFAGVTAPVTLFVTGLWAQGRRPSGGEGRREVRAGLGPGPRRGVRHEPGATRDPAPRPSPLLPPLLALRPPPSKPCTPPPRPPPPPPTPGRSSPRTCCCARRSRPA